MIGAIIGDIVGSPYEFDMGKKIKDFGEIFINESHFTDDSVMTVAVAKALMSIDRNANEETVKSAVISSMREYGKMYPYAGYGARFRHWLLEEHPEPYGSFGNGSAMRVSSVGWLYDSLERTREVARWTAEVTHNHPEGIKGAESTVSVIYLARHNVSKKEIKEYVTNTFNYDLSKTLSEIRPTYHHVESCQETVPQAITAFLEGEDFEDVIRNAVSLGGDCDTLTCIAGSMAEGMYKIPAPLSAKAFAALDASLQKILLQFKSKCNRM